MKLRNLLFDIVVGLPGGCLIFMGTVLGMTLLRMIFQEPPSWTMLVILCLVAVGVGMLARLLRPIHGVGSSIAIGIVAALIILFLWVKAVFGTEDTLVFGPFGMLAALLLPLLGAWLLPKIRRQPVTRSEAQSVSETPPPAK